MRSKRKEKKKPNMFLKIIITALFVAFVSVVINFAPNYIQDKLAGKVNVIINNNNVTRRLKHDVKIDDDGVIYFSFEDIENFFDGDIYHDKNYNQIITSSRTKLAAISIDKRQMYVNSSRVNIYASVLNEDNTYYLPFSEMKSVYNVEIKYSKDTDIVTIDSLDREQKMANSSKDAGVKYKSTMFSKTIDNVKKGEGVVVIEEENGWYKVRTDRGVIGYLKDVSNIYTTRETMEKEKQVEGRVSLVWDYFYSEAPNRTESIKGINVISPTFARLERLRKRENGG